jgi:crotonobetainyl-CoA:carnitine CoA-transferase CaiB-like acyl-CoA transferase
VLELDAVADHPQVRARGTIVAVDGPAGTRRYVRQPVRFDGSAGGPASQAPAVGAHTRAALRDAGLDEAGIDELVRSGAAHQG